MKRPVAAALAVLATPALAQTDDLIVNDIIRLLAANAGYTAMAGKCAAATDNDPAVVEGFAGYVERSQAWVIVGVTMIGSRGGMDDPAPLATARDREIELLTMRFEKDPDPARSCREFATGVLEKSLDITDFYPVEAERITEARNGERPPIDLATIPEVSAAMTLWGLYETRVKMLARCSVLTGDTELWDDAVSYYIDRNYAAYLEAKIVLTGWGASAPWRFDAVETLANMEADLAINGAPDGEQVCQGMIDVIEDGGIDLATLEPDTVAAVFSARSP